MVLGYAGGNLRQIRTQRKWGYQSSLYVQRRQHLFFSQGHRPCCFRHLCRVLDYWMVEEHHPLHHSRCIWLLVLLQRQAWGDAVWRNKRCLPSRDDVLFWQYQLWFFDRCTDQHAPTGREYCTATRGSVWQYSRFDRVLHLGLPN